MTSEQELHRVLTTLQELRDDRWGRQAASVAEGIAASGIPGYVDEMTRALESAARAVTHGIATISQDLQAQTAVLRNIERLLSAPASVASAERLRSGTKALGYGWVPESISELSASISLYPLNGAAHFQLARALLAAGDKARALESAQRAMRYLRPVDPSLYAASVLIAVRIAEDSDPETARGILAGALTGRPRCADLYLLKAHLDNDPDALMTALDVEPAIGLIAVGLGLEFAEEACERSVRDSESTVGKIRFIESASKEVGAVIDGRRVDPSDLVLRESVDVPECLVQGSKRLREFRRRGQSGEYDSLTRFRQSEYALRARGDSATSRDVQAALQLLEQARYVFRALPLDSVSPGN